VLSEQCGERLDAVEHGRAHIACRFQDGEAKISLVKEGEIIYCPAGVPHSPRLPSDAILLVLERKRRSEEVDRFLWRCERCGGDLYELSTQVRDYNDNVLRDAYEAFYKNARDDVQEVWSR
jgi:3-hydroxyanthranilate 3,4-dioxygenase